MEPLRIVDAFNPLTNWYDSDVIGIDTGIRMVMAENARSVRVGNFHEESGSAARDGTCRIEIVLGTAKAVGP